MKHLLFGGDQSVYSTRASLGILALRIGVGASMMMGHGWGKLSSFGTMSTKFADPFGLGPTVSLGLAVFAEFFCSLLVMTGTFTRLATVPLIVTMLTAFLIIHGADPFPRRELALMYLIPYVTLFITGPGRYSIDYLLWGGRRSSAESQPA